jgi:hypothetical protein
MAQRTGTAELSPKVLGILNRIKITPAQFREDIIRELLAELDTNPSAQENRMALFSEDAWPNKESWVIYNCLHATNSCKRPAAPPPPVQAKGQVANLREMLRWPEIRGNGLAVARIAKILNELRSSS